MSHPAPVPGSPGNPVPPRPVFQAPGYDTLSPASPYTVVFEPWPAATLGHDEDDVETQVGQPTMAAPAARAAERPTAEPSQSAAPDGDVLVAGVTDEPSAPATEPSAPATQRYVAATQQYVGPSPYGGAVEPPLAPTFMPPNVPVRGQPYPFPAGPLNGEPDPFALLRPPRAPSGFGSAKPRTENVGRGLATASLAVVAGCVLSAFVYHLGFVASIVALAMGAAGIFLYAKGAGAPPRKGAVALVVLLIAGILLAWVSSVGTELYFYYVDRTGTTQGALPFVLRGVLSLDLFTAMLKDFLIFVGFGLLGIFGVARRLLARRAR